MTKNHGFDLPDIRTNADLGRSSSIINDSSQMERSMSLSGFIASLEQNHDFFFISFESQTPLMIIEFYAFYFFFQILNYSDKKKIN